MAKGGLSTTFEIWTKKLNPQSGKIKFLDKQTENLHAECALKLTQIFANLRLGQAGVLEEELGDRQGREFNDRLLDEIVNTNIRDGVEQVQTNPVLPLGLHLLHEAPELVQGPVPLSLLSAALPPDLLEAAPGGVDLVVEVGDGGGQGGADLETTSWGVGCGFEVISKLG